MLHAEKDEIKNDLESITERMKGEYEDLKSENIVKEGIIEKLNSEKQLWIKGGGSVEGKVKSEVSEGILPKTKSTENDRIEVISHQEENLENKVDDNRKNKNIDEILLKIQQRKNKILDQRNNITTKLNRLGIKI